MNWIISNLGMLAWVPESVTGLAAALGGALAAIWVNRFIGSTTKPRK